TAWFRRDPIIGLELIRARSNRRARHRVRSRRLIAIERRNRRGDRRHRDGRQAKWKNKQRLHQDVPRAGGRRRSHGATLRSVFLDLQQRRRFSTNAAFVFDAAIEFSALIRSQKLRASSLTRLLTRSEIQVNLTYLIRKRRSKRAHLCVARCVFATRE